jgi:ribosomal protein L29
MSKTSQWKSEIRKKDIKACQRDLTEKEATILHESMKERTKEQKNPAKLIKLKKEIAILKTIIREKVEESLQTK